MENEVLLDAIFAGNAHGTVAQRLASNGMNIASLRPWQSSAGRMFITVNGKNIPTTNALLRKDEWEFYDTAVIREAKARLRFVNLLRSRGLTFNVPGLAKTVLSWEDQSDVEAAQVSMDGLERGDSDRPNWDLNYLPLPIVHAAFQLSVRELNESRNTGQSLDTATSELKARRVSDKTEDIFVNGLSSYTYGGGTIRGLTDHPDRNTVSTLVWTASATTGADIIDQVLDMKQALINDNFFGPYALLVPSVYETTLDKDYSTAKGSNTIRQRLQAIESIDTVMTLDDLATTDVVLVQLTSDVIRAVIGLEPTTIQWDFEGGMGMNFKVMSIIVPQLRSTQSNAMGVCHAS